MRPLVRNVILSCVLMMALSAHAALNTIVNPTLSTSVVDASVPTVSYTYNYMGQRVSKTVTQNTLPPTSVTTYYEYDDQGNLLGEYNANGNPLRQYVYLNGERVAMFDYSSGSKQTIYLANNHVGQMQYAWNSSGAVVDTRVQAPFGETASETPTGGLQIPVRFPGQVADSETGYSQNWNRDYDPSLGRYIESDPIGLDGGDVNIYSYVGQNSIMYIDPTGTNTATWGLRAAGGLGLTIPGAEPFGLALIMLSLSGDAGTSDQSRSIPMPQKPNSGCTCICRADANDNIKGNVKPGSPSFAFGTATACDCAQASKDAKRQATQALGMQPKHVGCRCAGK